MIDQILMNKQQNQIRYIYIYIYIYIFTYIIETKKKKKDKPGLKGHSRGGGVRKGSKAQGG
jgi:hypothetical protein